MNLMTKSQYAEKRGVSKPAITKLVKSGRIIINADGLVDVEMSDLILDNFSRPSQGTRVPTEEPTTTAVKPRKVKRTKAEQVAFNDMISAIGGEGDYNTARARLTLFMARIKEIEWKEKSGEMIPIDVVDRESFECARRTRDAIIAIEDRISDILAAETDRTKIKAILNQEHRQALDELANMPNINEFIKKHHEATDQKEEGDIS